MKSLNKLKLFLIVLLIALFSAGIFWLWQESLSQNLATDIFVSSGESANTSGYITLLPAYTRASVTSGGFMFSANVQNYKAAFRVFIPPGTMNFDLRIAEYGGQTAIARYEIPPTSPPVPLPSGYTATQPYTLSELETQEEYALENREGSLMIAADSFAKPYISLARGGWLYIKVGGGEYSSAYINDFQVSVDAATYNDWWDNYGSNSDGSINWEKDIESVTTYTAKKKLQGDIEPQTSPDGDVDIFDYNTFIQYWSQTATNNPADIDKNGKVDIFDYNLLVGNFGKS